MICFLTILLLEPGQSVICKVRRPESQLRFSATPISNISSSPEFWNIALHHTCTCMFSEPYVAV